MRKISFFKIILLLGDALVMYGALFLSVAIRNKDLLASFGNLSYGFLALYVFWLVLILILNLYDSYLFKKFIDFLFSLIIFSVLAFLSGTAYFYLLPQKDITPKTILILNVVIFDVLFVGWRYVFSLFLGAKGVKDKIIIIGDNPRLGEILSQINMNYEVLSFYKSSHKAIKLFQNEILTSNIENLKDIALKNKVQSILLAGGVYSESDLSKNFFSCLPSTLNYIDFNDLYESMAKKVPLERLGEAWFLQKISRSEEKFEQTAKRFCDIVLSLLGLVLFVIFFPFIAVAIKIDSDGSIFYDQERTGKGGKLLLVRKFRTMKEDKNQHKETWRERDEGNITKVGKVLRKLHLDELPQAWNILRGDLSFVGPRAEWAELTKIFEKEIPFYKQRYLVKPGIFGWAQINFPASKSVSEAREKFEYDLYYIKNRSLLLDFEIILKAIKFFIR